MAHPVPPVFQSVPMLEVESLACLKGDRLLFRDLAFRLQAGGLLRVAGPNGVGKTSLLRLLTGLSQPFAGGGVLERGEHPPLPG